MTETAPTDNPRSRQPTALTEVTAVAACLGVSVRHVRRLVHERRIPYIKWGHLIRFDPHQIEHWIDMARRDPGPDRDTRPERTRAAQSPKPARRS